MGNLCTSCCPSSSTVEDETPTLEEMRRKQMEAAERRIAEQEQRGIKNIEAVKRQQQRALQIEKMERESGLNDAKLKWQMN